MVREYGLETALNDDIDKLSNSVKAVTKKKEADMETVKTSDEALSELTDLCAVDVPSELYRPLINIIKGDLDLLKLLKAHTRLDRPYGTNLESIVYYTKNTDEDYGKDNPFLFCNFNCYTLNNMGNGIKDFNTVKEKFNLKYEDTYDNNLEKK